MIHTLLDFHGEGSLRFGDPVQVLSARTLPEVVPLLDQVEMASREGRWCVGFVTYEAAPAFDPAFKTLPPGDLPPAWFAVYDAPEDIRTDAGFRTQDIGPGTEKERTANEFVGPRVWTPGVDRDRYDRCVREIRNAIGRGDLYQANYTFPLAAQLECDPYILYNRLSGGGNCLFGALLDTGDCTLLSLSPELFFQRIGNTITTRPMKGTQKRGRWSSEDAALAEALANSAKDRAENIMIVDLLRNDLGRIAIPGTVAFSDLFRIEQYPTVWQMTSTITAEVEKHVTLAAIFGALFPCGSITGAPKIAAMQKLTSLELMPRGVYCGAIGFVKPGGDAIFSVAIRTMTLEKQSRTAIYPVGGGITWDSTVEGEYEEALSKARVLTEILPEFDLLETMRVESRSVQRLDRHLHRLKASADYFGRPISLCKIRDEVQRAASALESSSSSSSAAVAAASFRMRLTVSADGNIHVESSVLPNTSPVQEFQIATFCVNSSDRLLFHKTTHRPDYERAYAERGAAFDVLLYNEQGELTEFTRGNLVLEMDGRMVTPPVSCGLLGGVLRQELIESGAIQERIVNLSELANCSRVWFINSLRGWIEMKQTGILPE